MQIICYLWFILDDGCWWPDAPGPGACDKNSGTLAAKKMELCIPHQHLPVEPVTNLGHRNALRDWIQHGGCWRSGSNLNKYSVFWRIYRVFPSICHGLNQSRVKSSSCWTDSLSWSRWVKFSFTKNVKPTLVNSQACWDVAKLLLTCHLHHVDGKLDWSCYYQRLFLCGISGEENKPAFECHIVW